MVADQPQLSIASDHGTNLFTALNVHWIDLCIGWCLVCLVFLRIRNFETWRQVDLLWLAYDLLAEDPQLAHLVIAPTIQSQIQNTLFFETVDEMFEPERFIFIFDAKGLLIKAIRSIQYRFPVDPAIFNDILQKAQACRF
jgi:hypothetical protein